MSLVRSSLLCCSRFGIGPAREGVMLLLGLYIAAWLLLVLVGLQVVVWVFVGLVRVVSLVVVGLARLVSWAVTGPGLPALAHRSTGRGHHRRAGRHRRQPGGIVKTCGSACHAA